MDITYDQEFFWYVKVGKSQEGKQQQNHLLCCQNWNYIYLSIEWFIAKPAYDIGFDCHLKDTLK